MTEWIPITFDEDGNLDCPIPYEGQETGRRMDASTRAV